MIERAMVLAIMALLAGSALRAQAQTKESQAAMTPAQALERLKEGNRRFVSGTRKVRDLNAKGLATAAGQYPFAAMGAPGARSGPGDRRHVQPPHGG